MTAKRTILTYTGLRALEAELEELKVVRRKEVAQKIKEAREQGDSRVEGASSGSQTSHCVLT